MDDTWRGPLYELTADGSRGSTIPGSEVLIRRSGDAVEFEVRTAQLTPGNAYTVWLMAFNNPMACEDNGAPTGYRCGPSDMGNAAAGFGLMYGTGGFADDDSLSLTGRRSAGDQSGVELGSAGLSDASAAEIHIRVRDHGPAQPGFENDQVGTLMGGCTDESPPGGGSGGRGSYQCRDIQATGI